MLSLDALLWPGKRRPPSPITQAGLLLLALQAGACAMPDKSLGEGDESTGSVASGGTEAVDQELVKFDDASTLALAPFGVAELTVHVEPARRQTVTFEILSTTEPFDGFLMGNKVQADDLGMATVLLHAPSEPSTFVVRASLTDGAEDRRTIQVSDQGVGQVRVIPNYDGERVIDTWYASVWTGLSCEDLESWFSDSRLHSEGKSTVSVDDVPAGTLFSVSLRGDLLAGGCVTVTDLSTDELLEVEVPVVDRPINPEAGTLDLIFGVDSATAEFASMLETSISDGASEFLNDFAGDASALLQLIKQGLPTESKDAFEDAISSYELTTQVESELSSATAISDTIRSLLTNASIEIVGETVFQAELALNGAESEFTLISAARIDAELAGFSVPGLWQVEVGTGDTVTLGGEIRYNPILWLGMIAEAQAAAAGEDDPVNALQQAAACQDVAPSIVSALGSTSLPGCDEVCLLSACQEQVSVLWERVKQSGTSNTLLIGASGKANVRDEAEVDHLVGTWVGKNDGGATSLKGPMSADRK